MQDRLKNPKFEKTPKNLKKWENLGSLTIKKGLYFKITMILKVYTRCVEVRARKCNLYQNWKKRIDFAYFFK